MQRWTTRSLTFRPLPTHVLQISPLLSKVVKLFFSTAPILLAYKHISNFQAQTYSTITTQILHCIVFYYAAQCEHILLTLTLFMGRAFHLWTATRFRAPTPTTNSAASAVLRFLTWPVPSPRTTPSSLAVLPWAASSLFFSFSFFLANRSLCLCWK